MAEYNFIKPDFIPVGMRVDADDDEGGVPEDAIPPLVKDKSLPSAEEACTTQPSAPTPAESPLAMVVSFLFTS